MRSLRYVAFLLVVFATTSAFCSDRSGDTSIPVRQSSVTRDANGNFHFQIAPDANHSRQFTLPPSVRTADSADARKQRAKALALDALRDRIEHESANVCYFIRSYIMKREGDTGATHLERVETCTPGGQIHMKQTVRVIPAIAR